MWNSLACQSYDVCSTRRITEAQRKHLQQLSRAKSAINMQKPWQPSHSLSKWSNKYTNTRNEKIQHDNKVLLEKMMFIDKKNTEMNPRRMQEQVHPIKSMAEYLRRRNQENLADQNNKIIERIQTATKKSTYGKEIWLPDSKKCELYKSNILRSKQKVQGIDYTHLTKINYPNEKFIIRKVHNNSSQPNFFNSKPITPNERQHENKNVPDDIDFKL